MIRVGIVGFGFMGRMHYRCWKAIEGVTITAICDANPKAFTSLQAAAGNISGAADDIDFTGVTTFSDFDKMLSSGITDVVSITLPTNMHRDFTVKALAANQHVLCEKPMALTADDCNVMISAAKESDGLLQIGHCIRFWPEYVVARNLIKSGKYGLVLAANFQRFSPMPSWNTSSWFTDENRSGGMPLDLHVHDTDFIHYLFGMPAAVSSVADPDMTHMLTTFLYDHGPIVTAEASWRVAKSFGFKMSFIITLENATLVFDCTLKPTLKVYPAEGEPFAPELGPGDAYAREIEHFARKIKGEQVEQVLSIEECRDTVRIVLAEKKSARQRDTVIIMPKG